MPINLTQRSPKDVGLLAVLVFSATGLVLNAAIALATPVASIGLGF